MSVAVDHGAAELQLAHTALEFIGGGFGVLHGEMGETGIAVGALLHFVGEEIVRGARLAHCRRGVALDLNAGSGDRQHDARDAGLVHGRKPPLTEIGEAAEQLGGLGRGDIDHGRPPVVHRAGIQEMLFQGDLLDHTSSRKLSTDRRKADRGPVPYFRHPVYHAREWQICTREEAFQWLKKSVA